MHTSGLSYNHENYNAAEINTSENILSDSMGAAFEPHDQEDDVVHSSEQNNSLPFGDEARVSNPNNYSSPTNIMNHLNPTPAYQQCDFTHQNNNPPLSSSQQLVNPQEILPTLYNHAHELTTVSNPPMNSLNPYVAQTLILRDFIKTSGNNTSSNFQKALLETIRGTFMSINELQNEVNRRKEKKLQLERDKFENKRVNEEKDRQVQLSTLELQQKYELEKLKLQNEAEINKLDKINAGKQLENEHLLIEKGLMTYPSNRAVSTSTSCERRRVTNTKKTIEYEKRSTIKNTKCVNKSGQSNTSREQPLDNVSTHITHTFKPVIISDEELIQYWTDKFLSMENVLESIEEFEEYDLNNPCNLVISYIETASPLFVLLTTVYFYDVFTHKIRMQMRDKSNVYDYACKKSTCVRCTYNKEQEVAKGDDAIIIPCYGNLSPLFCGPILYIDTDFVYIHLELATTFYSYFNLSCGVDHLNWKLLPDDIHTCGYTEFNDRLKYYFAIKSQIRDPINKIGAYYIDRRIFNHFMSLIIHEEIASPTLSPDFNLSDDLNSKNYFYPPAFCQYKTKNKKKNGTTPHTINLMPKINPSSCPSVMPTKWNMVEMVGAIAPPMYINGDTNEIPSHIDDYQLTTLYEDSLTYMDTRNRDKIKNKFIGLNKLRNVTDKHKFSILSYSKKMTDVLVPLNHESIIAFKTHLKSAFPKFNVSRITLQKQKINNDRIRKRKSSDNDHDVSEPVSNPNKKSHLPPFKIARNALKKNTKQNASLPKQVTTDDENDQVMSPHLNDNVLSPHPDDLSESSSSESSSSDSD